MTNSSLRFFLAGEYRRFLLEVNDVERCIVARQRGDQTLGDQALSPEAIRADLSTLLAQQSDRLEGLIQQATPAFKAGYEKSKELLPLAQHLMAKVADRRFSTLQWWGREAWVAHPLGKDVLPPEGLEGTILEQAEALVQQADQGAVQQAEQATESPNSVPLDLLQVYLLTLSLDFADLTEEEAQRVPEVRKQLSDYIVSHDEALAAPSEHLFPVAYRRTNRLGATGFLPRTGRWMVALLIVGAGLFVFSSWLWWDATETVRKLAEDIVALLQVPAE